MATDWQPVHVTATIGSDSSTWPADWPPFATGNISGGASLGGGISAFRTLKYAPQYYRSAVGNNPGSLRPGPFADRHGAIGSENGFAVFPIFADGMMATADLLDGDSYNGLTVNEAIAEWAPPSENDTASYQAFVRDNMARSDQYVTYGPGYIKPTDYGSVTIADLTDSQFTALVFGIFAREGRMTIAHPPPGGDG